MRHDKNHVANLKQKTSDIFKAKNSKFVSLKHQIDQEIELVKKEMLDCAGVEFYLSSLERASQSLADFKLPESFDYEDNVFKHRCGVLDAEMKDFVDAMYKMYQERHMKQNCITHV